MINEIGLKQVIEAVESADDSYVQYLDKETGKTVYLPDYDITGELDEELEALLESSTGRFLPFPTKHEIHQYSIMEAFIDELPEGSAKRELDGAIRGKGAFRRFKNGIRYHGIEQAWYDYLAAAYRNIAIRWCVDNDLLFYEGENPDQHQWDLDKAHTFCSNNMPMLKKDKLCGCFFCLEIFDPAQISDFIEADNDCDGLGTAICPYCGIDSVISESSGFPISTEFLNRMHQRWF